MVNNRYDPLEDANATYTHRKINAPCHREELFAYFVHPAYVYPPYLDVEIATTTSDYSKTDYLSLQYYLTSDKEIKPYCFHQNDPFFLPSDHYVPSFQ